MATCARRMQLGSGQQVGNLCRTLRCSLCRYLPSDLHCSKTRIAGTVDSQSATCGYDRHGLVAQAGGMRPIRDLQTGLVTGMGWGTRYGNLIANTLGVSPSARRDLDVFTEHLGPIWKWPWFSAIPRHTRNWPNQATLPRRFVANQRPELTSHATSIAFIPTGSARSRSDLTPRSC